MKKPITIYLNSRDFSPSRGAAFVLKKETKSIPDKKARQNRRACRDKNNL